MIYDVAVIGGGPVGSHVACLLAAGGYRVIVLEQKPAPGWKSACTGIIGLECARHFQVDDSLVLRKINSASLVSPSGTVLELHREETQAVVLDRHAFDISLVERAQAAGAEYAFGCSVRAIENSADQAKVLYNSGSAVEARAAVVASGLSTRLAESLGLGLGRCADFTMGVQTEVKTIGPEEVRVYFGREIAPGFFAWLVPAAAPGIARAGLLARRGAAAYLKKFLDKLVEERRVVPDSFRFSWGCIPLRAPPRTYGDRLLVVGDAAGQVKPTTGGGLYYGLLSADLAAETILQALSDNDLSATRLSHYQRRWRRRLARELEAGYWARRIFERLTDRQIDSIFRMLTASGLHTTLLERTDLSFDWHSGIVSGLVGHTVFSGLLRQRRRSQRDAV